MKAVLFDLDGTLVDTAPDLAAAADALRVARGLPALPLSHYRPWASAGARGLIHAALGVAPDDAEFPALRERFLADYREGLARQSRVFPGLDAALDWMDEQGIPWGVVTNKPSWLTNPLVAALGLDRRMAVCVSADEAPAPKPDPSALLLACTRASLSPAACLYVGDDRRDIDAGRAAGMQTIAVDWGYLGQAGPIDAWGADHRIEYAEELLPFLKTHLKLPTAASH